MGQNNLVPLRHPSTWHRRLVLIVSVFLTTLLGLVGAGVASAQPYLPPPPPPQPILPHHIRLYADPQQREILFEIEILPGYLTSGVNSVQSHGITVYEGPAAASHRILFFDGETVFQGGSNQGHPEGPRLFAVEPWNGRVYAGANNKGPLLYTLEWRTGRIRSGGAKGPFLFAISDDKLHLGANNKGPVVFFSDVHLAFTGPIQFLLPILADGRFR